MNSILLKSQHFPSIEYSVKNFFRLLQSKLRWNELETVKSLPKNWKLYKYPRFKSSSIDRWRFQPGTFGKIRLFDRPKFCRIYIARNGLHPTVQFFQRPDVSEQVSFRDRILQRVSGTEVQLQSALYYRISTKFCCACIDFLWSNFCVAGIILNETYKITYVAYISVSSLN